MKEVIDAFEVLLTDDPIIAANVGYDDNHQVKVYPLLAPADTPAPFIIWQALPGASPTGHYHDLDALDPQDIQITCWGRTRGEVWKLYDVVQNVVDQAELSVELTPYTMLQVVRTGGRGEDYEPEVGWFSVISTYRITLAR